MSLHPDAAAMPERESEPQTGQVKEHEIESMVHSRFLSLWALKTADALESVLTPGYLNALRDMGFRVGDRIVATVGPQPEYIDLVLTDVHPKRDIRVALMKDVRHEAALAELA